MLFQYQPNTHRLTSAATTNATSVKAAPCRLMNVVVSNTNAAARYLKLYNKASAPVVGTDVPILTIPLPPTSQPAVPMGLFGLDFSLGLAYAITAGAADADVAAVGAGDVKVNLAHI